MTLYRVLLLATLATLAACSTQLDRNVKEAVATSSRDLMTKGLVTTADTSSLGAPAQVASQGRSLNRDQLVTASSKPWVGGIQASRRDAQLPAVFDQVHVLDFGSDRVTLNTVASRLSRLTGIPVRVRADVVETSTGRATTATPVAATNAVPASAAGMPQVPLQALAPKTSSPMDTQGEGGDRSLVVRASPATINALEMRWNGTLRGFLDHLTNSLSLAWEYQDGAVVILRLVTESYQMAATPGRQAFSISSGGTGSAGGSEGGVQVTSKSTTNITTTGMVDVRESVLKNVRDMIANVPNSFANWSDGTSRLLVTTSKENQAKVRSYLEKENKSLSQRVNVTFDIYTVKSKDNDEQGVDWSSFFNSLNTRYGIQFKSPAQLTGTSAGTLAVSATSRDLTTTNNAVLALLAQYGESVQHRPVSLTSSQGVWETEGSISTVGYIKETTPGTASSSGAAGAPGLKTDLITTGDSFAAMPIVLADNSTLLRFSITLSDLIGLFDVTTGSGETLQKVQTPQIQAVTKNSMINLAPGETAVISGLSRHVAKRSENRLGKDIPLLAGGSRSAEIATEHLLILVRATPL